MQRYHQFRRAQNTWGMAGTAVLSNDVIGSTHRRQRQQRQHHTLALFTHHTDLANRLQSLGNGIVGRGLSSHCPQGQYGSRGYQDFLIRFTVHPLRG